MSYVYSSTGIANNDFLTGVIKTTFTKCSFLEFSENWHKLICIQCGQSTHWKHE